MTADYQVSILICTRNRLQSLLETIESIKRSTLAPHEIIVSDDSTNDLTVAALRDSGVFYTKGPCRGLGANRNHAVKFASGNCVLFLDDDAMLGEFFLETLYSFREQIPNKEKCIITGIEQHPDGLRVYPAEQSFLGYQNVSYSDTDALATVVINSSLFPKELFSVLSFDERIVYGYDEVDLTTRALTQGYRIELCETAVNLHNRAEANRDFYTGYYDSSRIYVTAKRYLFTQKYPGKALLFLCLAPVHLLVSSLKRRGIAGIVHTTRTICVISAHLNSYFRELRA